ncbi:hypothetical protein [Neisseria animaloris]|uniref:Uncharacterized protein n=1 Tax=Neisseria animaloris TaxID=326522 RepID=A0A3S4ZBR3_9NEIS|nr:hypothetical protein [Neisseria animaloris]VEJ21022.1 Uncharacterised protein [Neisseria animaloris]
MNQKETFQFNLMKQGMISGGLTALERLMLERDFDEEQEDLLYDMLDEFSERPNFTYGEFERRADELFGWSYQGVKGLIISLHDDSRWSEVVYQYLKSNRESMGQLSIEYHRVAEELNLL